jgi:hypothetical protein
VRRSKALALAAALVVALGGAGLLALTHEDRPRPLLLGISDERPESLGDPRLRALGVRHARVQASWDLLLPERSDPARFPALADERRRVAAWLAAARASGMREVLLALKASRDLPDEAPTPERHRAGLAALLAWIDAQGAGGLVGAISPWNEPNLVAATRARPRLAGSYFPAVRRACAARGCVAVAGDFADRPFSRSYLSAYLRGAGEPAPRVWGWHAYEDAWSRALDDSLPRLRGFVAALAVGARVWLTEQGGIVRRLRPGDDGRIAQDEARAAGDLRFLLARAPRAGRRPIERFYVYQWLGEPPPRWDSGLIAPDGRARESYCVLARRAGLRC